MSRATADRHRQRPLPVGSRPTARRAAVRLVAVAGLVGVVAGGPAVLVPVSLGGPLRAASVALHHPAGLADLLARHVGDGEVVDALVVLAWAAWAWATACLAVDVWARLHGRAPRRLPCSRWLQRMVEVALGSTMAVVPLAGAHLALGRIAHPAATALAAAVPAVPAEPAEPTASRAAPARRVVPGWAAERRAGPTTGARVVAAPGPGPSPTLRPAAPAAGRTTYVVQPGDTLWSIAAARLGSPLRWRDILALNQGRLEPGGGRLVDPHWIEPGWRLVLPTAAVVVPVARPGAGTAQVPPPAAGGTVLATSRTTSAPGTAGNEAGAARRAGGAGAAGAAGGVPDGGALAGPAAGAGAERSTAAPGAAHGGVAPLEVVEFGALAAGVVALVDRLRRVQQRHRPSGLRIALPTDDVRALEARLRPGADAVPQAVAAAALARVQEAAARSHLPAAVAVRVGPARVEVLFGESPAALPVPPFGPGSRADRWTVARDRLAGAEGREADRAGHGAVLATLGRDGDEVVFVDLAAARSLAVADDRGPSAVLAMAVELATSPLVGDLELVLAGCPESFYAFDRVRRVDGLARACAIAEQRVAEGIAVRHDGGPGTAPLPAGAAPAVGQHGRTAGEGMPEGPLGGSDDSAARVPTVICVATPPDPADGPLLRRLVELAHEGGGAVAVVAGQGIPGVAWTARSSGGAVGLQRTECGAAGDAERTVVAVVPQVLGAEAAERIGRLVGAATDLHAVAPSEAAPIRAHPGGVAFDPVGAGPVDGSRSAAPQGTAVGGDPPGTAPLDPAGPGGTRPGERAARLAASDCSRTGTVEVRVLGPVDVVGAERPFVRAWSIDLVVYLALHPAGATTDQWATALWPDRLMAPASLHSTASAARRALGSDDQGCDHLPRAHGRLRLADTVTTDWRRFAEGAAAADPATWRRCLELVRGRPLDGLRATDWAVLEGILPTIESTVVDVAHRLATACLDEGDSDGARWAARQGLLVSPYDERLYRDLLRAADLAGNPAGVEAAMAELVRLVAEDVEPYDAVHPETLELYRALSRRGERAAPR